MRVNDVQCETLAHILPPMRLSSLRTKVRVKVLAVTFISDLDDALFIGCFKLRPFRNPTHQEQWNAHMVHVNESGSREMKAVRTRKGNS